VLEAAAVTLNYAGEAGLHLLELIEDEAMVGSMESVVLWRVVVESVGSKGLGQRV
jgi:hypothetical protein